MRRKLTGRTNGVRVHRPGPPPAVGVPLLPPLQLGAALIVGALICTRHSLNPAQASQLEPPVSVTEAPLVSPVLHAGHTPDTTPGDTRGAAPKNLQG